MLVHLLSVVPQSVLMVLGLLDVRVYEVKDGLSDFRLKLKPVKHLAGDGLSLLQLNAALD